MPRNQQSMIISKAKPNTFLKKEQPTQSWWSRYSTNNTMRSKDVTTSGLAIKQTIEDITQVISQLAVPINRSRDNFPEPTSQWWHLQTFPTIRCFNLLNRVSTGCILLISRYWCFIILLNDFYEIIRFIAPSFLRCNFSLFGFVRYVEITATLPADNFPVFCD